MAYYEGNGVVKRSIEFLSKKYKNRDILIDPIAKKIYFLCILRLTLVSKK